jgi:hypothetical protein
MTAMSHPSIEQALLICGRGEADAPEMTLFPPQLKTVVRYADPTSWIAATAVARALSALPNGEGSEHLRHGIGLVAVSEHGPADAVSAIAENAAQASSSPIRYPASNAGSLAGVSCIAHHLRGPTMVLTMPPAIGVPAALTLARAWTKSRRGVTMVVVVACMATEHRKYRMRCLLMGGAAVGAGAPATDQDRQWLKFEI